MLAVLLSACGSDVRLPQAFPTSAAPVAVTATPPAGAEPGAEAAAAESPGGEVGGCSPLVVLPGSGGVSVACEANTLRLPLAVGGVPVGAASRILSDGDALYLVADGGLYRAGRAGVDAGAPELEPLLVPGTRVAGPVVHELADLTYDPDAEVIYALDKAGHLYRLALATGSLTLDYRAVMDPDAELTEQMLAVTLDERGRPVLLDTAFGALWTPDDLETLDLIGQSQALAEGVDVTYSGGRYYIVQRDGAIVTVSQPVGSSRWQGDEGRELPLSLAISGHLGVDTLVAVDGLRREVTVVRPGSGEALTRHVFGFTDMGLLRDAVFAGGRLYALADGDLYVFPGRADGDAGAACPPPNPEGYARPHLYGHDVLAVTRGWQFPLEGGSLPAWPRLYPGAGRFYRQGVHHGLDLYHWNAPEGFNVGWQIVAPAGGQVTEATVGYVPVTAGEFDRLVASSMAAGGTSPDALERFSGIMVELDHGGGVRTAYLHLHETADDAATGAAVRQGQFIGTVGVTGTEGEPRPQYAAPHLHFEIWLGDRYLGQGITLAETMWWFEQIFGAD